MKYANIVVTVELIMPISEPTTPSERDVEAALVDAAKNGRWIHVTFPKIVWVRSEEVEP